MGSFSVVHWVIVLLVVVLVFGTKKLGNVGADLGKAVKGFKDGVKSTEDLSAEAPHQQTSAAAKPAQVADQSILDIEAKETLHSPHQRRA